MKPSPWKNGGGLTTEIAISPGSASFEVGEFDWRVSQATISQSGPFSKFPGYDRVLCVWQGDGIRLNGKLVALDQATRFFGEDLSEAELVGSPIQDLGIIFRRGVINADVGIFTVDTLKAMSIKPSVGQVLIFVGEGKVSLRGGSASGSGRVEGGLQLDQGDAALLEFSKTGAMICETGDSAKIIVVEIGRKSGS